MVPGLPLTIALVALLQVSTGWLRGPDGMALVDMVLVLTLCAGWWKGPGLGFVCGAIGGLIVGSPAGLSIATALFYSTSGVLAGAVARQGRWSGSAALLGVAALLTILLAAWHSLLLSQGLEPLASALPLAVHDVVGLALCLGTGHLVRRLRTV